MLTRAALSGTSRPPIHTCRSRTAAVSYADIACRRLPRTVTSVLFPNHLAKERAAAGLTRGELASRSGVDVRLYTEMEEGRLLPGYPALERSRASLDAIEPPTIYGYSLVNTSGDKRVA